MGYTYEKYTWPDEHTSLGKAECVVAQQPLHSAVQSGVREQSSVLHCSLKPKSCRNTGRPRCHHWSGRRAFRKVPSCRAPWSCLHPSCSCVFLDTLLSLSEPPFLHSLSQVNKPLVGHESSVKLHQMPSTHKCTINCSYV